MTDSLNQSISTNKVLQRSSRMGKPEFIAAAAQYIPATDKILNAGDCWLDVLDIYPSHAARDSHSGVAVVLTDRRLIILRPSGLLKQKKPLVIDLEYITEVEVQTDGAGNPVVAVGFRRPIDIPHKWLLHLNDSSSADLWEAVIQQAREALQSADENKRQAQLSAQLDELRRQQES